MARQARGKKHVMNMRRKARRLWQTVNYDKDLRDECVREVLKRHRQSLIEDFAKHRQQELQFCCDNNGWIG